jgi:type IX secretion system PorP/SprF family membrane protein
MKIKATTKLLLIGLFLTANSPLFAQDPGFSQFFSNPIYLNPAYAGSAGCSRATVNYRNQWPAISGNFVTYSASYDQPIDFLSGGVGIHFMSDYSGGGTIISNSINGTYAYNLKLGEHLKIRPAISVGYGQKRLDGSKLTTLVYDSINNTYSLAPLLDYNPKSEIFNIGAGVLIAYKSFCAGISIDHVNEPNEGFISISKLPRKVTVHCNYQFDISEKIKLTPGLISQGQIMFANFIPSLMLNINHFKIGAASRFNRNNIDCIIGMVGYRNNWLNIGYSYDYTLSGLTDGTGGSHEISAIFLFNHKEKFEKYRIVPFEGF